LSATAFLERTQLSEKYPRKNNNLHLELRLGIQISMVVEFNLGRFTTEESLYLGHCIIKGKKPPNTIVGIQLHAVPV
jgi:hypothetical protein